MRRYTQICADIRRYAPICADMGRYTQICADIRRYTPICADMRRYTQICAVRFHNVVACVSGVWRESFLGFGATPRTSTHNSVCRRISAHICAYLHILVRICVYRPIAHTYTKHPRARFASLSVWHGSITPKIPEHTCSGIFGVSVVVVGTVELHQKSPSTRARGFLV